MSDDHVITRRDFVRGSVAAALGTTTVSWTHAAPARGSSVVLIRDPNVLNSRNEVNVQALRQMLSRAVVRFTGAKSESEAWRMLVSPKDVIGLVSTEHLNRTHRELVDAVRDGLAGAGIGQDNIRMATGGPEDARACTALISLPALKAHWLTGLGTVLKNYIKFSGNPPQYHDENNVKLGEIWNMPHVKGKTRLIVIDALRPLCDKGPQPDPRYLWNYNGLIAGKDPVALDTISLKIITEKRRALRGEPWPLSPPPLCVTAAGEKYGLGTSNLAEITIERIGWSQDVLV